MTATLSVHRVARVPFPEIAPSPRAISLSSIGQWIQIYRAARIVLTAVKWDLFSRLRERKWTDVALSDMLGSDPSTTRIWLNALCALGFLRKTGNRYGNTPVSRRLLTRSSPDYCGDNLKYQDDLWTAWSELPRLLKQGRPRRPLNRLLSGGGGFAGDYIRGMDNIAKKPARELAALIPCPPHAHLLDIGAGPGTYAAAFLRRNPSMIATLFDLPASSRHARRLILRQPKSIRRRIRWAAGDYHSSSFGQGIADIVLLSHVTHDEGDEDNLRILSKAADALRPGGRVVVHDFILNQDEISPWFSALFSMHLRTYTSKGRVYTEEEYARWFQRSGLTITHRLAVCGDSPTPTTALVATASSTALFSRNGHGRDGHGHEKSPSRRHRP